MKYIYIIKPREKSNEDKDLIFFFTFYKQRLSCKQSSYSAFYELPTYWTLSHGESTVYNNKDVLLCTDLTHP